ncbi:MAG TPA: hypothetical protein VLB80_04550 [Candidatus Babeliales bacterium]|nr:hypothetical protein [Candidatus Babeliales bacterium]
MNIFRTISHVLVVAVIVFAGHAVASENGNNWGSKIKDMGKGACKGAGKTLNNHKFQFIAQQYMDQLVPDKKNYFKRATIRAGAKFADLQLKRYEVINSNKDTVVPLSHVSTKDAIDLGISFGLDLAMCEIGDRLNEGGYNLDYVAEKCDRLPDGKIKNIVNPAVRFVAEKATEPEVLTAAAMYVLHNYIIPNFTEK